MMYFDESPDDLNREADAFAKKWALIIKRAKTPNPAKMHERVREELERLRSDQQLEDGKYVHNTVMALLYDMLGHRTFEVPEPVTLRNSGLRPKDWA